MRSTPSRSLAVAATALAGVLLVRWRQTGGVDWSSPEGRPLDGPLAGRVAGKGAPGTLLLHGAFNAGRYWGAAYDGLGDRGELVVPDLLGFGRSPRPPTGYTVDAHVDAVAETLRTAGAVSPVTVGAHSIGGLVALRLASAHPDLVARVVAFAPPIYEDESSAKAHIERVDPLARLFLANERLSRWVCDLMCRHRRAATLLVRLVRPSLPAELARDRVEHSWASYSETVANLVLAAQAPEWLADIGCPITLVAGDGDRSIDRAFLEALERAHPNVDVMIVEDGGHDLPHTHADSCCELLISGVDQMKGGRSGSGS